MIETTLLNYLNDNLSVDCYMEVPLSGTSFCVLERTGGNKSDSVIHAQFAIQSYAKSMCQSANLNEEVKRVMSGFSLLKNIGSAKLLSDYNFTDTQKKRYRYQAIYDIYFTE